MSSFSREFLEPAYTDPISNFILPCLMKDNCKIPLMCLLQNYGTSVKNPWHLHSILVLAEGHPGISLYSRLYFLWNS